MDAPDVSEWLDEIYRLDRAGAMDEGTYAIFSDVDEWLLDGRFDTVNLVLQRVDCGRLSSYLCRSLAVISAPARGRLPAWADYVRRARARVAELRGDPVARRLFAWEGGEQQ